MKLCNVLSGRQNTNVRQLLKKLQRERTELEWQLKDCEWRLDQEAAVSTLE